jgi:uncharacterized membrane protein YkvA (DUF1232 family)
MAVAFAALWVLSPIDLSPEFLSFIGPLDDVVEVASILSYPARRIPREVLAHAWTANRTSWNASSAVVSRQSIGGPLGSFRSLLDPPRCILVETMSPSTPSLRRF